MPSTFHVRAKLALLREMPDDAKALVLEEFPKAEISVTELSIEVNVPASSQREAAAEALAHVFASLDRAGLRDGADFSLETFGTDGSG